MSLGDSVHLNSPKATGLFECLWGLKKWPSNKIHYDTVTVLVKGVLAIEA